MTITAKKTVCRVCLCVVLAASGGRASAQTPAPAVPAIKHTPVKVAVPAQAISLRAVVMTKGPELKSVNLYYTPSSDVAPFKVPMHDAGGGAYIGTIDAVLLTGLDKITYYLEAVDAEGAMAETSWYEVSIGGSAAEEGEVPPVEKTRSWKKPVLIGGGLAAVAGGTALAVAGGSGGGGGAGTNATVYAGSATVGLQVSGAAAEYDTYAIGITVTAAGTVGSDSLRPGHYMEAALTQNDFLLSAPVEEDDGTTGEIQFVGTVLEDRISGSVHGSVTTGDGRSGIYVGNFSATKQ